MDRVAIDLGREEIPNLRARRRRADSRGETLADERSRDLPGRAADKPGDRRDVCRSVLRGGRGAKAWARNAGRPGDPGEDTGRRRSPAENGSAGRASSQRGVVPNRSALGSPPKTESRDRKTMCGMREALVGARTKAINTVRGWLRSRGRRIERGGRASLRQRVAAAWEGALPSYVERQLQVIDVLNTQIAESNAEVESWAEADETCARLMTVPGVGSLTALRFVAALDDVTRFESAHQVESYHGLVPGESSSSERQQRLSITKAGPRAHRWVLVQAAWALHTRCRKPEAIPLQLWAHRIEQRRGKRTAIIALARKLAGILFAIWRDRTVYDGSRGAKMI